MSRTTAGDGLSTDCEDCFFSQFAPESSECSWKDCQDLKEDPAVEPVELDDDEMDSDDDEIELVNGCSLTMNSTVTKLQPLCVGLVRGRRVLNIGTPITVPIGRATLGRIMNVLGEPSMREAKLVRSLSHT